MFQVIATLKSNLLLHVVQKEKIAPKITAEITGVNGPQNVRRILDHYSLIQLSLQFGERSSLW